MDGKSCETDQDLAKMKEELTTASRELAELELENARLEEVLKTKEVQKTKEELAKAMSRLEEVRQRNTSLRQKLEQDRDEEPSSKEGETRTKDNLSVKLSRRISTRVGDLFKPKPKPKPAPAIVDEFPPKIDEPVPVAPLEN